MGTALVSLFLLSNGTVLCARYGWRVNVLLLEMGYRHRSITIMTQLYSALLSAMFAIWLFERRGCTLLPA